MRVPDIGQTVPFPVVRFRASELAVAAGGTLVGDDGWLDGLSFDSRDLTPGHLFVALTGERDGHLFVDSAVASGAGGLLVSRTPDRPMPVPVVVVEDTLAAMGELAGHLRRGVLAGAVTVGITGSVGKTSTKDLVVGALGGRQRVVANPRSFNNEQGLPWTVANAPIDSGVLVLEMGMRGPGQIADLCRIARPSIGVVTAVGHAHTELLGGLDGVAAAKGELIEALPGDGTAVLNADDARVAAMASRTRSRVITYGSGGDVRIARISLDTRSRATLVVDSPWGRVETTLAIPGRHMASNALAAIAVAGVVHGDLDEVADGLAGVHGSDHRMRLVTTGDGLTIVDDCYNANPTSMFAAVEAVVAMDARRRVAVLGPMAEVADTTERHLEVAAALRDAGVALVAVGTDLYGISASPAPLDDITALLEGWEPRDAIVLVKGSRVARLETLVDAIASSRPASPHQDTRPASDVPGGG